MKPALFDLDPGGFQFGVVVEGVYGFTPSVTALFEAAKGYGHIPAKVIIDAHGARAFRLCKSALPDGFWVWEAA